MRHAAGPRRSLQDQRILSTSQHSERRPQGTAAQDPYRIGDLLRRYRAAIQRELFNRERSRLDIPDAIASYDLTNVHCHGHADGELPRFGRSRQKRDDCPPITLALALGGVGFPCSCEIPPGNVSEPGTLEDALVRLEGVYGGTAPKPMVVMDAGIASEENIVWPGERGYDWIAVSRGARPAPDRRHVDRQPPGHAPGRRGCRNLLGGGR